MFSREWVFWVFTNDDVCAHMRKWHWIIQTIYNKHVWYREAFQLDDRQTFMEKSWCMWQQSPLSSCVFHWFSTITLQHKSVLQWHWINAAGHQWRGESQTADIVPYRDWQTILQTLIVTECHFDWRTSSDTEVIIIINDYLEIARWLYVQYVQENITMIVLLGFLAYLLQITWYFTWLL